MEITEKTMEMARCSGHNVIITLNSGGAIEGKACYFVPPYDNEPEIAEIDIKREGYSGLVCITEPEIEKIIILD